MLTRLCIAILLVAAVAVVAGGGEEAAGGDGRRTVVATTTQAADLARNVAGDHAEVIGLLAPNADPHDYEVRPHDLQALADADLIVRSGGDVDEWLQEAIEGAGSQAPVLTLSDHVHTLGGDPHWWQDPRNALAAVGAIERALGVDAAAYHARLRALDRAVAACIGAVPAERRKLVTTHDALGYYARRYGIEVIGAVIPSLSTRGQPSAGEVAALVRTIRDAGRARDLRRELGQREGRAGDRARDRRARRPPAVGRHARARRARTARPTSSRSPPTPRRWWRASPAPRRPAMPEAFEAPFMQRALLESLLLAALAGVLGSWIVLRRLAFFTHGVGTAAFPGLVVAGAAGIAPQLSALAGALAVRRRGRGAAAHAPRGDRRGDRPRAGRRPRARRGARLRRVRDRRGRRPAAVRQPDRPQRPRPVADGRRGGRGAAARGRPAAVVARAGLRPGVRAGARGPRGAGRRLLLLAIAAAAVVALDAVGALLVTAVLVIPAATVRLVAPSVGVLQVGTALLAAVEGVAGLWLAYELNVGPGPATAVLGGAVFALVAVLR